MKSINTLHVCYSLAQGFGWLGHLLREEIHHCWQDRLNIVHRYFRAFLQTELVNKTEVTLFNTHGKRCIAPFHFFCFTNGNWGREMNEIDNDTMQLARKGSHGGTHGPVAEMDSLVGPDGLFLVDLPRRDWNPFLRFDLFRTSGLLKPPQLHFLSVCRKQKMGVKEDGSSWLVKSVKSVKLVGAGSCQSEAFLSSLFKTQIQHTTQKNKVSQGFSLERIIDALGCSN